MLVTCVKLDRNNKYIIHLCILPLCALLLFSMTHYDIKMGNERLLRMHHCGIIVGNDVVRDIHCDVTMDNDVAMCTFHGITVHNDVAMNLFCYILLRQCMILLFHQ